MPAKYRVGIIASGRIAREHARGWQECEHTQIVAIADSHPQALAQFGHDFHVSRRYLDYREMMERENLDIISICSWDPQHAEMTIAASVYQPKVILCEKPMALSIGEADAMMIACQRNNVKLAIGHQRRFYSAWQEARRLMLCEGLEAASASYRVGYESPSQFSREYSRLFGAPPLRDLARLVVQRVYHRLLAMAAQSLS